MKTKEEVLREWVEISNDRGLTPEKKLLREQLLLLEVALDLRGALIQATPKRKE